MFKIIFVTTFHFNNRADTHLVVNIKHHVIGLNPISNQWIISAPVYLE